MSMRKKPDNNKDRRPKRKAGWRKGVPMAGDHPKGPHQTGKVPERDELESIAINALQRENVLLYFINRLQSKPDLKMFPPNIADEYKVFSSDLPSLSGRNDRGDLSAYGALQNVDFDALVRDINYCHAQLREPGVAKALQRLITERIKIILAEQVQKRFDKVVLDFWKAMEEVFVPMGGELDNYAIDNKRVSFTLQYNHCGFEISVPTKLEADRQKAAIKPIPLVVTVAASVNYVRAWTRSYTPEHHLQLYKHLRQAIRDTHPK